MSRGECVLHLSEHHGDACPGSALRIETDELEAFQQQASGQARLRIAQLQACGLEVVQDAVPRAQGVWPVILLRMPSQQARDAVLRAHWGGGCGLSLPFVHVLPDYGCYDHVLDFARHDDVSRARDWAQRLLAISNSPWLDDVRFARVLANIQAATQG